MKNSMYILRRLTLVCTTLLFMSVAVAQEEYTTDYEPVPCFDGVTADECAYVTVPEDRNNPDGPTIRLPVAVTRSDNPTGDPVILLSGGPGEAGLIYAELAPLFPNNDFIVFDHRGVNLAEPALQCSEYDELIEMSAELEPGELAQALIDCAASWRDEGINLDAYTTSAAAADVFDIVRALGYEQVNLIGGSYGTRWAQEVMRDYPQIVSSAVLDSVIPPEIDRPALTARASNESLARVFAACATDEACNAAYPNLDMVLQDLLTSLEAESVIVTLGGEEAEMDHNVFMSFVFSSLYLRQGVAELPALIYETAAGNYELLQTGAASSFAETVAETIDYGLFFVTECNSEVAFSDSTLQADEYDELALWGGVFSSSPSIASPFIYDLCKDMGLTQDAVDDNDPLESDIPTLMAAGEYDPVTPPSWLEQAADGLDNVYVYEIPTFAHSAILGSQCSLGVLQSFIADPTTEPDTSCFDTFTFNFLILDDNATVNFVTYEGQGFNTSVPEGWTELQEGLFSRQPDASDNTFVITLVFPSSIGITADVLSQYLTQLGLTPPDEYTPETVNEREWLTYETSIQDLGISLKVAGAEVGEQVYILGFQSSSGAFSSLEPIIFTELIQNFTTTADF